MRSDDDVVVRSDDDVVVHSDDDVIVRSDDDVIVRSDDDVVVRSDDVVKGIVRTSFPSEPVCYLSLDRFQHVSFSPSSCRDRWWLG